MTMIYRTALRLMGRSAWVDPASGDDPLSAMTADVVARHPAIEHWWSADLAALLATNPERVALFDVRQPAEFAISHLPAAQLVVPGGGSSMAMVLAALKARPDTEVAVFYCAVGVRSSALANRVQRAGLMPTLRVVNLAGGLFGWANSGRAMTNADGTTRAIHSFNRHWQRFLVRRGAEEGR